MARALTLSVPRVELRFYRSSRTSCDNIKHPPHFEYILRCEWAEAPAAEDGAGAGRWWDELPQKYTLKRRWLDVVRFHEVLVSKLAVDEYGYKRGKAKTPVLPAKGELDKFLVETAATGDSMALARKERWDPQEMDALDTLHMIYVEGRLAPYFRDINALLAEVPAEVLEASPDFRKFVTTGSRCQPRHEDPLRPQSRFCGPSPVRIDPKELEATAARWRKAHPKSPAGAASPSGAEKDPPARREPRRPAPPALAPLAPDAPSPTAAVRSPSDPGSGAASPTVRTEFRSERSCQRLASSHYGFFAQTLKGAEMCDSTRDFWRRMVAKEKREFGRRLPCTDSELQPAWKVAAPKRLPELPQPLYSDPFRSTASTQNTWQLSTSSSAMGLKEGFKTQMMLDVEERIAKMVEEKKVNRPLEMRRAITEGFRVVILNESPPRDDKESLRTTGSLEDREATREETVKVYRAYRSMLEMMETSRLQAGADGEEAAVVDGDSEDDFRPMKREVSVHEGLRPVSWPGLLAWAQYTVDMAIDFRYKSVSAALHRSLKEWGLQTPPAARQRGVPVTHLFQWIWQGVSAEQITQMLTWVCLHEIEVIRKPTPRVIEASERRSLDVLFSTMDHKAVGHCTPEDVAGGRDQGIDAKLKNIVDADTVMAVAGTESIDHLPFLELMCQDDMRAHKDATHVALSTGSSLVQQSREVLGVKIWVLEDVPESEVAQRSLIDAIESEVSRWRTCPPAQLPLRPGEMAF